MIHTALLIFVISLICYGQVALFLLPHYGIVFNGILIVLFLGLAIYDAYDLYAEDVLTLAAVIPTVSLVSIALQGDDIFTNIVVVYALLLFLTIGYAYFLYIKHGIFLIRNSKYLLVSLPVGIITGYFTAQFLLGVSHPLVISQASAYSIIILGSITEGIFFQGLVQNAVTLMTESLLGVVFTMILYAVFHDSHSPQITEIFLLLGFISAMMYVFFKNIYVSIGFLLAANVIFYMLTGTILAVAIN